MSADVFASSLFILWFEGINPRSSEKPYRPSVQSLSPPPAAAILISRYLATWKALQLPDSSERNHTGCHHCFSGGLMDFPIAQEYLGAHPVFPPWGTCAWHIIVNLNVPWPLLSPRRGQKCKTISRWTRVQRSHLLSFPSTQTFELREWSEIIIQDNPAGVCRVGGEAHCHTLPRSVGGICWPDCGWGAHGPCT